MPRPDSASCWSVDSTNFVNFCKFFFGRILKSLECIMAPSPQAGLAGTPDAPLSAIPKLRQPQLQRGGIGPKSRGVVIANKLDQGP